MITFLIKHTHRKRDTLDSAAKFLEVLLKSHHLLFGVFLGLGCLLATCLFRPSISKRTRLMPEAIGKGIASYLSAVKPVAPEPVKKEPIEPIIRREPDPSRSVEVSISQEAMYRKKGQ